MASKHVVGLISDTHGLLRPGAIEALRGSDAIVHAGDIGDPAILTALSRLAPVTAVRGNVDTAGWADAIPAAEVLQAPGPTLLYVLHDIEDLDLDPVAAGFAAVIHGHSHQPGQRRKDGVLYVNPGSVGPRRFTLPVSLGRLVIEDGAITVEFVTLAVG